MAIETDTSNKTLSNTNVFLGNKYRITVLTPRLIRFEYNPDGKFVDDLTELVMFRGFNMPEIYAKQDEKYLQISSKYFVLEYEKEKHFRAGKSLRVGLIGTDDYWYYGHPEVRNMYGSNVSIEKFEKKMSLKKGLYSLNGFSTIDDSKSLLYDAKTNIFRMKDFKSIDLYLFIYNKDFGLCLNDYFMLTGYPPLIPRYALGVWWCKDDKYSAYNVRDITNNFIRRGIPLSIILLDNKWRKTIKAGDKEFLTSFTFDDKLFPNPKDMINDVHNKGIRLGLSVEPQKFIVGEELDLFPNTKPINNMIKYNASDPIFLNEYYNNAIGSLEKMAIDFFFIDYLPKDNNLSNLLIMNFYQFMHQKNNMNQRSMILSRNPTKAGHRYPILYSGRTKVNFDLLKYIPFYNLSSANIGISWWSHDIGGYYGGIEDNELYIRSVQLGVFSPIFRFHGGPGKYVKREPWRWDIKTYKIVDDYLKLRNKLIPYLYSEGYKYHKKGLPLIQPLYYRYPWTFDDLIYRNQYYLGSELLISPISDRKETVMNRTIHKFFIPEGTWYDFRTGKKFTGGIKYISFYKDEDYPVFAKSGAIIPLSNNNPSDITAPKELEIHIFPGKSNTFNLFEDDGSTMLYQEGYYLLSAIDYNYQENNYTVIIRSIEGKSGIIPDKRNYKIRFRNTKIADEVVVYFNKDKYPSTSYVDDNDFVVEVKDVQTVGQLTINCKGKDIEIDALRVVNDDIDSILMDLQIETSIKDKISEIIFNDSLELSKKRVEIRKLKRIGLEKLYIKLFLRLLEYINKI